MRSDTETSGAAATPLGTLCAQLLRFGGVGTIVAAFNYAGFLALLALRVDYLWACFLSWIPSVALGYILNRAATFRVAGRPTFREGARFAIAALAQLATAMAGLAILVEYFGLAPLPASLVNIVVGATINFAVLRAFVFATARGV